VRKEELLADEVLMIEDGGEMPEVALNSSLYYLSQDPDGPQLKLCAEDVWPLKNAVVRRYGTIILRDLQPENRTKSIYRGLARSLANWFRLLKYCQQEGVSCRQVQAEAGEHLVHFLGVEWRDVCEGRAESCVNCRRWELEDFAESLGVDLDVQAKGWQGLFGQVDA